MRRITHPNASAYNNSARRLIKWRVFEADTYQAGAFVRRPSVRVYFAFRTNHGTRHTELPGRTRWRARQHSEIPPETATSGVKDQIHRAYAAVHVHRRSAGHALERKQPDGDSSRPLMTNVCERCGQNNRANAMFCIGCAGKLPNFAPSGPSALQALTQLEGRGRTEQPLSEGGQGGQGVQRGHRGHRGPGNHPVPLIPRSLRPEVLQPRSRRTVSHATGRQPTDSST